MPANIMPAEIDVAGVFVPTLLVLSVVAYAAASLLRRWLTRFGLYKLVWHRALFDLGLFVVVLGGVFATAQRWIGS